MFDLTLSYYLNSGDTSKQRKKLAKFKNNVNFINVYNRLFADAMERYTLKGLPETCSERVALRSLITRASVVFFENNDSLFSLPGAPSGTLNIYGEPNNAYVFAINGMLNKDISLYIHGSDKDAFLNKTNDGVIIKEGKGVIVWENKTRYPFMNYIINFAENISDSYRTIEVARNNLKNPFVVTAEESVVPTVNRFFEERDQNNQYVISSGVFPVDKINILPIATQGSTLSDCIELVDWYENKYRELCGLDSNSQIDKKGENLISDEIHMNDEYEAICVDKCIDTVNEGLDDVNKIFGTHIKCERKVKQNDDIQRDENAQSLPLSGNNSGGSQAGN